MFSEKGKLSPQTDFESPWPIECTAKKRHFKKTPNWLCKDKDNFTPVYGIPYNPPKILDFVFKKDFQILYLRFFYLQRFLKIKSDFRLHVQKAFFFKSKPRGRDQQSHALKWTWFFQKPPIVCSRGHKENVTSHRKLSLVFFNTFDPIQLSPESVMHEKEVPMLCEDAPGQIPTMYSCPLINVLGRMPLIPCYMDGQKHQNIPYRFRKSHLGGAIADSRLDNGTGSRLYEVNIIWLWNYERSCHGQYLLQKQTRSYKREWSRADSKVLKQRGDVVRRGRCHPD